MKLVICNCPPTASGPLSALLVARKLAACVNISAPVSSIYVWEGEVCRDQECTLLIKCAIPRIPQLVTTLREEHPYDVPEILVVDVDLERSYQPYVDWVRAECTPPV